VALGLAAVILAWHLRIIVPPVPETATVVACWLLATIFILRAIGDFRLVGFFKRVRGSPFAQWDTAAYSPLCLVLGLAITVICAWHS